MLIAHSLKEKLRLVDALLQFFINTYIQHIIFIVCVFINVVFYLAEHYKSKHIC